VRSWYPGIEEVGNHGTDHYLCEYCHAFLQGFPEPAIRYGRQDPFPGKVSASGYDDQGPVSGLNAGKLHRTGLFQPVHEKKI
jgi:hypothetical protein